MFSASTRTLKMLAAVLWYSGAIILLSKGTALLLEADSLQPGRIWAWLTVVLGLSIGWLKVKFIFRRACQKNLARISLLSEPKIWQFYRPGFLLFLAAMIIIGSTLSGMAHGNYPFLIAMAILDFSLATALFGSSYVFWQHQDFNKQTVDQKLQ
ncbi:MAG: hypothetical protein ABFS24_04440 [Pseudomonadota bacterium]